VLRLARSFPGDNVSAKRLFRISQTVAGVSPFSKVGKILMGEGNYASGLAVWAFAAARGRRDAQLGLEIAHVEDVSPGFDSHKLHVNVVDKAGPDGGSQGILELAKMYESGDLRNDDTEDRVAQLRALAEAARLGRQPPVPSEAEIRALAARVESDLGRARLIWIAAQSDEASERVCRAATQIEDPATSEALLQLAYIAGSWGADDSLGRRYFAAGAAEVAAAPLNDTYRSAVERLGAARPRLLALSAAYLRCEGPEGGGLKAEMRALLEDDHLDGTEESAAHALYLFAQEHFVPGRQERVLDLWDLAAARGGRRSQMAFGALEAVGIDGQWFPVCRSGTPVDEAAERGVFKLFLSVTRLWELKCFFKLGQPLDRHAPEMHLLLETEGLPYALYRFAGDLVHEDRLADATKLWAISAAYGCDEARNALNLTEELCIGGIGSVPSRPTLSCPCVRDGPLCSAP
jgi:hypothetical protein